MKIIDGGNYTREVVFEKRTGPHGQPFYGEIANLWGTISHYFKPGRKVLEIGPGYWPVPVVKKDLTVVDRIKHHEDVLKKKAGTVHIGYAEKLVKDLFQDDSFDIICSVHSLEHIENWDEALEIWWGKLKTHGHLIVAVPVIWYYPAIKEKTGNDDHKDDFTLGSLLHAMLNNLDRIEIELAHVRGSHTAQNAFYREIYGDTYTSYKHERGCLVVARKLAGPNYR